MTAGTFPWNRLGIAPTGDVAAIRRAYADALRATDIDNDIAGYADLRRARDHALWLAAQGVREAADGDGDGDWDDGAAFGLGNLDDDAADPDDGFPGLRWDDDDAAGWQGSQELRGADRPAPVPDADPDLTEGQRRAQEAWNRLLDVMYPAGETSDAAVTHAELDEGMGALGVLIARAEEADLAEHDALDTALAELFARTWPRSAPFVEPANAAFRWLEESGSLEERPALRFLNQRLKGMRFHDKVQAPDHPLHKAWEELSRPGRAGLTDRLRVKRLDVHKLLTGIRERYPELESHLDPQRVASWEGEVASAAEGRRRGGGFGSAALIIIAALAVFRVLVPIMTDADDTKAEPVDVAAVERAESDLAAADLFGKGVGIDEVKAADAVFAGDLRKVVRTVGYNPEAVLAFGRLKALHSGAAGDFDALVARGELKRLWLRAARGSPEVCRAVLGGGFAGQPLALGDAPRREEQTLMKRLLDARALSGTGEQEGGSFSVPGWVIEQTTARSGLPPDTVSAALGDPGHPSRCALELAMLDVMLRAPAKVPVELLRAL